MGLADVDSGCLPSQEYWHGQASPTEVWLISREIGIGFHAKATWLNQVAFMDKRRCRNSGIRINSGD